MIYYFVSLILNYHFMVKRMGCISLRWDVPFCCCCCCFFYLGFLTRTFAYHRTKGEVEANFLTPFNYLHLNTYTRHLQIIRAIAAENSPLGIATSWIQTGNRQFCSDFVYRPLFICI